jgi:hypothetical protein
MPEEKKMIDQNAKNVGLSTSTYLRNIGIGIEVKGILDQKAVGDMAKVNADLGRLGGLLKMWLSNDERLAMFNQEQVKASILEALGKIKTAQDELLKTVKRL